MSKIYDFPNSNNQDSQDEQEHVCDGCASAAIHEIAHNGFEEFDPEPMLEYYLDVIFEAVDNDDPEAVVDAAFELFQESFDAGYLQSKKNMIHRLSGEMVMLTSEVAGEEQ